METIGLMQMSLSGALLILAVVVIRSVAIDRLPKRLFPILWAIIMARLILPVTVPLRVSAYSLPDLPAPPMPATLPEEFPAFTGAGANTAPRAGLPVLSLIWLVGAAILAGYFLVSYVRSGREFRTSLPVRSPFTDAWLNDHALRRRIELRELAGLSTPLTYGVFRPVILVPGGMNWEDEGRMRYMLYHEYVHIRRLDAVWKLVVVLVLCVHWFNPLVWVLYVLFNRDMELACDEQVLRHFGWDERAAYARLLIRMEEERGNLTALGTYFSKNATEERVKHIMKFKKSTIFTLIIAVIIVAAGVVTAFTVGASSACFTLNGDAYAAAPTLGDFLANGWALSEEDAAKLEDFSQYPWQIFTLESDGYRFAVYLNAADVESGMELADCRVRTLDFSSGLPRSFTIDGHEISGVSGEDIQKFFGEPDEATELEWGEFYYYSELGDDFFDVTFYISYEFGVGWSLLQFTLNQ